MTKIFRKLNRECKIWLLSILADWLLVYVVFFYCYWQIASASISFGHYSSGIWIVISILSGKLKFKNIRNVFTAILTFLFVNTISMAVIYFCSSFTGVKMYQTSEWMLVFLTLTLLELFGYIVYWSFRKGDTYTFEPQLDEVVNSAEEQKVAIESTIGNRKEQMDKLLAVLQADPIRNAHWADQHKNDLPTGVEVTYNDGRTEQKEFRGSIHLNVCRLNDIRHINQYFRRLNAGTTRGDIFIFRVMVHTVRKGMFLSTFPFPLNYVLYFIDYLWNRVFPKLYITRSFYFFITKGRHIVFPHAEILGRMYSCGFEILGEELIGDDLYISVYNSRKPYENVPSNYAIIISLIRVGEGGKLIKVFKFRTMSAYAEYLQPFMYERYHLKAGGKFQNDFRINTVGKRFRQTWFDEIPMIINWLIGDLKLVGVRPLSPQYFSLYEKDLQQLRVKTKPGLIPPFYADMPKTMAEIEASEEKYLKAYFKNPHKTDWVYFWKIMNNIVFKHKRSS